MKHALVVDDSSFIRKIAKQILEGMNFEVSEAKDGAQALEQCEKRLPELILLDWNMPVMSGLEFLNKLRKMPRGNEPQVVFCTTENTREKIMTALEAGATEYIMKPFDQDIIRTKLEQIGMVSRPLPAGSRLAPAASPKPQLRSERTCPSHSMHCANSCAVTPA